MESGGLERLSFMWKVQAQAHEKLSICPVEVPASKALNPQTSDLLVKRNKRQQHIFSCGTSADDHKIINEK